MSDGDLEELRAQIIEQDQVICTLIRELQRLSRIIHFLKHPPGTESVAGPYNGE